MVSFWDNMKGQRGKGWTIILCCFLEYVWYNVIVIICSMNINIGKNKIPNNYVPSGGNSKKSINFL